ncbi:ubiquitin-conjugating enzyme E2 T-like [Oratosquilla oratoria]|uniref:ubiquitin-conjugating enzyme E2 T-like n=1 Tax=Oratosquilla oratoria TaxID=337810 RepID=UPI003F76F096
MAGLQRMHKEIKMLRKSLPAGISCWPVGDRIDKLEAVIMGGDDTVYESGIFKLEIDIPERYPFQPPKVRFMTKIYHPNIDDAGRICLDVLKLPPSGSWRPAHNMHTVLTSIQLLMATPNPNDPLMADIAEEYKFRRSQFEMQAREWTKLHATTTDSECGTSKRGVDGEQENASSSGVQDQTHVSDLSHIWSTAHFPIPISSMIKTFITP